MIHVNKVNVHVLRYLGLQKLGTSQWENLVQLLRHLTGERLHLLPTGKRWQSLLAIDFQNPRLEVIASHFFG